MSSLTTGAPATDRTWGERVDRAAPVLFATYLALGFVVLVSVGSSGWLSSGDLYLLTSSRVDDVFVPVEQHWTTVPILLYRGVFAVAGFELWPFLVLVVLSHLAVAALVYLVARRSAVRPWVSALVASSMVLFAPGYLSMIIPIQLTQNLSLICGFGQLLLADHDGRDRRRDALALGVGLIGLMSSGIMPALVLATGLALLVRRGWRSAALQTVPLAVIFVAWYVLKDANQQSPYLPYQAPYDLSTHLRTVGRGVGAAFEAMGSGTTGALLLALVLVVGLAVRLLRERPLDAIRSIAAPLAFALTAVVYLALVAYQRSAGTEDYIEWSHHAYNAIVLCLPALAVAVAALVDRWKVLVPVAVASCVVVIAANVRFDAADRVTQHSTSFLLAGKDALLDAAEDPRLDELATTTPDASPFAGTIFSFIGLDYAEIRELRDAGKLPDR